MFCLYLITFKKKDGGERERERERERGGGGGGVAHEISIDN